MKTELGIYVRTEEGKIFKTDGDKFYLSNDKKIFYRLLTRIPHESASYKVKKASYNIIDLIEVGDYVNGRKVTEVGKIFPITNSKIIDCKYEMAGNVVCWAYSNKDIKSVLTHEQFECMEWKIDEE